MPKANESAWLIEQRKYEINRLESVLRNSTLTDIERDIAQDQLAFYLQQSKQPIMN